MVSGKMLCTKPYMDLRSKSGLGFRGLGVDCLGVLGLVFRVEGSDLRQPPS